MSMFDCAGCRLAGCRPHVLVIALPLLFLLAQHPAFSQISATLSGTVTDPTGAVVPHATVTLRNQASADLRTATSNSEGFFNFQAINPGTYTLSIEAAGFKSWQHPDITLDPGDQRKVPNIVLQVGSESAAITVTADQSSVSLDSGAVSTVLSSTDLERLSTEGRDATELLRIIPGSTTQTGLGNSPWYGGGTLQAGIGSSAVGSFVINGTQPYGGVQESADGATTTDVGCMCANTQSMNMDMLSEVNIQTASFGADSPSGPVVINAIGKSGTASFHGEGYFYARNSVLNANTYANEAAGQAKTPSHYYYPGGNVGGPVLIPGLHKFNSDKKLLFWTGYENYQQQTAGNGGVPLESYVPTAGMRTGDFSLASIAAMCPQGYATNQQFCSQPVLNGQPVTQIPASMIDPGAAGLMKFIPAANANDATSNGYDYVLPYFESANGYQYHLRVDYRINDRNKVFVSYNQQKETDTTHVNEYWVGGNMVEYPSPLDGRSDSHTATLNYTTILSPWITNEAIGTYVYLNVPSKFANPSLVDRSAYNFPSSYYGIYNNGVQQMPGINNFGAGAGLGFIPMTGMGSGNELINRKANPGFQDNLSWVKGTHTMKFGAFVQRSFNAGTEVGVPTNGEYSFGNSGTWNYNGNPSFPGTGNSVANALLGLTTGFEQANFAGSTSMSYFTYSFYGQDSWKLTNRLTVNYGLRLEHIGPWMDDHGLGMAVFNPALYNPNAPAGTFTGIVWHAIDPSVPNSGVSNVPAFYASPRGGLAYDVFGTGKTVIRGGWGMYRFQDAPNGGLLTPGLGEITASTSPGDMTMAQIQSYHPTVSGTVTPGSLGSVNVISPNDNQRAETIDYSFTIDQRLPGNSLLSISYIGNRSLHLNNSQFNGVNTSNTNVIPFGAFFNSDPLTGAAPNPSNPNSNDYRPYPAYQSIDVIQNNEWSKYNSMQIAWHKQRGRITFNVNYTWSKVIGVNTGADPYNINNDIGLMSYDRPHALNTSYTFSLGNPLRSYWLFNGAVNGWTLAGITTLQSGLPLQPNYGQNFGMSCVGNGCPALGSNLYLGSSDISLQPLLTCNPGSHLASGQYANGSCFAVPGVGQNGPVELPYALWSPAFFDTDLAVYKDFKIKERQSVQFRFDAFNFLNHPINAFTSTPPLQFRYNNGTYSSNVNAQFGFVNTENDNRVLELALKYRF